ncbi:MAG TPA: c-type cytochrome [Candidatus Eisenbacteria bacterium]|nr:c-type cytochrome [Candidatus Eisenbacteria bacterium]
MAKPSPSLYSIAKTFMWFAIVSLVLTGSLVAIVMTDYTRDWKGWQKKFAKLKYETAKKDLKEAEGRVDKNALAAAQKQVDEAAKTLAGHQADREKLKKEIEALDQKALRKRQAFQKLKQYEDSYKYFYEENRQEKKDRAAEKYRQRLARLSPQVVQAKIDQEEAEKARDDKQAELDGLLAAEKTARKSLDKVLEEKKRVEARLEKVKPSLAKDVLNAPMLDFVAPTLQVKQIVLSNLYDDYHFAKTQKVDRCVTCHLGIDQKGYEDAPQPFRTHPNLELYLGSASPHPMEKIGCTVCHSGSGHSVSFVDSAHTPSDEKQAAEWKKKYGWHELEKWDAKMLPLQHTQAACAKCHRDTVLVPGADKLNKGRKLAEQSGCFNCHKVSGFENRWKVGPDLEHAGSKLNKEWMSRWIRDPRSFRDSTRMPRIFHLSNTSSPEDAARNDAAIQAITAYLLKNSDPVELSKPPVAGDAARGEDLVKKVGCTGCHTVAGVDANHFGPELSGLGSKVTPEWLYTWLKNPKHFSPNTRMPSLRLSDQEASDIASYLLTLKNEKFEAAPSPAADPKVVDEMILTNMQGTMRRSEAVAELGKMSAEDRLLYLGKRSILHQGCFGCHTIKGFEDAKPIGAELTNEGVKDVHLFDFGFQHDLEHSRQAWIAQKLKEPRIFDAGREKVYYEKLRMPQFNFTGEEVEALTTFVLSLTQEEMPLEMQKRLDLDERNMEKGRLLVSKLNCNGCHTLDGTPGVLREIAEDPGAAPPVLEGEGSKVQERWLHDFLQSPATIRPWLKYRMPTFGFQEEELDTFVRYFTAKAHEEIAYRGLVLPPTTPEKLAAGQDLMGKLQCVKCHQVNSASAAMGASFLAPDLVLAKKRLKPEWVHKWITDPQTLEPGTMMPTFFADGETPLPDILGGKTDDQITAIRDYLYTYEGAPAAAGKEAADKQQSA